MIATLIILVFIVMTNYMKYAGVKLIKSGKSHGIFVIMATKVMFWLSLIELVQIWASGILIYFLPVAFLVFLFYIFAERKLYFQAFKRKKYADT